MDPTRKILQDAFAFRSSIMLLSAVEAGLFDLFREKSVLTAPQVSHLKGWTLRGSEIFLNALAGLGYLKKHDEQFEIAPAFREVFASENYSLLREWLMHQWRLLRRWTQILEVLETGKPARELNREPRGANHHNFILSMAHREKRVLPDVLNMISLEGRHHLLDLGGGPGIFAIALAEKYPDLRATVYDVPETEPLARQFFEQSPARERLDFRGGDFLHEELGENYDVVLLSSILHIYGPEENRTLLKKVFRALQPGGKIIIRDFLLFRNKTKPLFAALFAVNMLINTQSGNAYSAAEIKSWLKEAGFRHFRTGRFSDKWGIIDAVKPAETIRRGPQDQRSSK